MKRYLLFDSGCSLCSKLARDIEEIAEGWLIARSLGDQSMKALLKEAKPDWRWQPTLLEVDDEEMHVITGLALVVKMVVSLGLRRAWYIAQLMHQVKEVPKVDTGRRQFLRQSGALLAVAPLFSLSRFGKGHFLSSGKDTTMWTRYKDPDFGFSVEHPSGWQVETKEKQPTPLIDNEAILKRVVISSLPALVYLDIWQTKGKNFTDWLASSVNFAL